LTGRACDRRSTSARFEKPVVPQAQVSSIFALNQGTPRMARWIRAAFEWDVVHSVFGGFRFSSCVTYPVSVLLKFGMS
jgi:hypothetical protein